jgi:hypothetical protein
MKKNVLASIILSFICCFISIVNAQSLETGLVGHYPFNGNANDESGNGNNGTVKGAQLTTDRFGNGNSAYLFDGIDDEIFLGTNLYNSNQGTFSAWIYILNKNATNHLPILVQTETTSNTNTFRFLIWTDSLSVACDSRKCQGNNALVWSRAKKTIVDSTWIHVVVTSDGTTHTYYVDGVNYGYATLHNPSGEWFDDQCSGSKSVFIGKFLRPASKSFFNGKIDDIRIYDREVNAHEVLELFNEGKKPSFISHPQNQTICTGRNSILLTSATGIPPFTYKWLKNGLIVTGAIDSFFVIVNAQLADSGNYSCIVSNAFGADTSNIAIVDVQFVSPSTILGSDKVDEWQSATYSVTQLAGHQYSFSVIGGNEISTTANSITVQWGATGWGHILLLETNSLGCVGDTVDFVVGIGNIIGLNENIQNENEVYFPNPVSTFLYFNKKQRIIIYSLEGKPILSAYTDKINVSSLKNGVYILRIHNTYSKFLKQ